VLRRHHEPIRPDKRSNPEKPGVRRDGVYPGARVDYWIALSRTRARRLVVTEASRGNGRIDPDLHRAAEVSFRVQQVLPPLRIE
jgi:hypothetical protein